jgi:hypothetical protein
MLQTIAMPPGTRLFRLSRVVYPNAEFYGRNARFRFDAPDRSFGVCYCGTSLDAAFLEVLRPAVMLRGSRRLIHESYLAQYYATVVHAIQPLVLAHLADDGLALNGIDQRVTAGDDYTLSQRWSKAIHDHHLSADGILYATRHHNALYAVALYERARQKVVFAVPHWGVLGDRQTPDLWDEMSRILERFGIDLATPE